MVDYLNGKKVIDAYRVYTEYVTSQIGDLVFTPKTGSAINLGNQTSSGSQTKVTTGSGLVLADTGAVTQATFYYNSDDCIRLGLNGTDGTANYNFLICGSNNTFSSYGLITPSPNPTLHVASATAVVTSTLQRICISHEGTAGSDGYGLIESKKGVTRLVGADGFETQGNAQLDTTGKYSGETAIIDVDENDVGVGCALYMKADGDLAKADFNATSTAPCICLAIDTGTGSNKRVLLRGFIRRDDPWNWTVGPGVSGLIYLGEAGALTQTAPSGSGDVVQIVGYAVTADMIYFNPSLNYSVVA